MNISPHFSPHFSIWYSSPTGLLTRPPTLDLTKALTHSVKFIHFTQYHPPLIGASVVRSWTSVIVLFFHLHQYFTKSPALYCTTLTFPFVIKTLLKTQPTLFHLHQHTESTCEEERERERQKKKVKKGPLIRSSKKIGTPPKELLSISVPGINKDINKKKVKRPVDTFLRKDRNTTKDLLRVSQCQTKIKTLSHK